MYFAIFRKSGKQPTFLPSQIKPQVNEAHIAFDIKDM